VRRPLVVTVAVVLGLALVGTASASFPGSNGRVAFSRSVGNGQNYDIYSMRYGGADKQPLVTSRYVDLEPAYSADGQHLVFVRDVDNRIAHANLEIFTKDLTTGEVVRRTNNPAVDWNPSFSPSGSIVVFSSDRGPGTEFDIHSLQLSTGDVTRLARPGDDFSPTFLPNGLGVIWSGYRPNGRADIFGRAVFATENQKLTNTRKKSEEEPSVSPAGDTFVYQRWGLRRDADPEIVIQNPDRSKVVLTRNGHSDLRPVFSPSGNRIVWERSWDGTDTSGQIWTMRLDGAQKHARTPRAYDADSPDWQPVP
jgi:Tol biopolymer transport system component